MSVLDGATVTLRLVAAASPSLGRRCRVSFLSQYVHRMSCRRRCAFTLNGCCSHLIDWTARCEDERNELIITFKVGVNLDGQMCICERAPPFLSLSQIKSGNEQGPLCRRRNYQPQPRRYFVQFVGKQLTEGTEVNLGRAEARSISTLSHTYAAQFFLPWSIGNCMDTAICHLHISLSCYLLLKYLLPLLVLESRIYAAPSTFDVLGLSEPLLPSLRRGLQFSKERRAFPRAFPPSGSMHHSPLLSNFCFLPPQLPVERCWLACLLVK